MKKQIPENSETNEESRGGKETTHQNQAHTHTNITKTTAKKSKPNKDQKNNAKNNNRLVTCFTKQMTNFPKGK